MTDYSTLIQPDKGQSARTIHLVGEAGYDDWLKARTPRERAALVAANYKPTAFAYAILPADNPDDWAIVSGLGNGTTLTSWGLATLAERLPEGNYRLAEGHPGKALFGWVTGQYRFTRYKAEKEPRGDRVLLTSDVAAIAPVLAEARAVMLVRDMVNTPAADMGPAALEAEAARIAKAHHAKLTVTKSDALAEGFPLIHAVGRAADKSHAPRLIELHWGKDEHPRVAIVGKGVCFDSGGLDIKPASGMLLMKKDMGGAAHALALADLVMAAGLPVRLHCLVPAVENAISGNAFRPGDIIKSRKGLTVEIGNTDAEGRLVLADALTKAEEEAPELTIDFATLTGAARVALGPDLPALFANDDSLADALLAAGKTTDDPLWRMPLWDAYGDMLKSDIADINNSGNSPFAGSVTAALFLKMFAPAKGQWAHFDTFAWRPTAKPGRAKGGDALGLRAAWAVLRERYGRRAG